MKKYTWSFIILNIFFSIVYYSNSYYLDLDSVFHINNPNTEKKGKNTPVGTFERIEYSFNLKGSETKIKQDITFIDNGNYFFSVQEVQDSSIGVMEAYVSGNYVYSYKERIISLKTNKFDFNDNINNEIRKKIIFNNPQSPIIKSFTKLSFGDYDFEKEREYSLLFFGNFLCYIDLTFESTRCLNRISTPNIY